MKFESTYHRLLFAYITILVIILGTFAMAIRVIFAHSLNQQLLARLTEIGESAAAEYTISPNFSAQHILQIVPNLHYYHQGIQWFDPQGKLLNQQGDLQFSMPLLFHHAIQQQWHPSIEAVTLPMIHPQTHQTIGYIRVMQTMEDINHTLNKLDAGLLGGISLALVGAGLGGIVLLRQAMAPVEASFQRLQQFTADASHEFRSPLTVIKSNATVALKYSDDMREGDRTKFGAILSATQQMIHLTEDLLLLARGDSETIVSNSSTSIDQSIDLSQLLLKLIQWYCPEAESRSLHLRYEIESELSLQGNYVHLTRLFSNLIDNAIIYNKPGGIVTIIAQKQGSQIYVQVKDTGIGIAPHNLAYVFDRFWRADESRHFAKEGSGLGLAIVKNIVEQHHGKIHVESQFQQSSCFSVWFPRK